MGEEIMEEQGRPSWDEYFLTLVDHVASRATCDRGRSGCVIGWSCSALRSFTMRPSASAASRPVAAFTGGARI